MAFTNSKTFLYNAHILKSFFEDLDRWREECACFGIRSTIEDQQYDDLFKGTDADVYIPMWASACKGHGDILIDRTTYDCIRFYKAYGYEAIHMDGNPADFLGEQLRFLEYISVCGLKGTGNAGLVIEAFIEQFTLDTVKEFCKSLRAQNAVPISEELGFVCEALEALVRLQPKALVTEIGCDEFYCWQWSQKPPLPVEEPHIVRSAGVNNCGGNCKLEVWCAEGCVLDISADTTINGVQLRTCPRGRGYRHTFLTSHRLRYPMKRREARGSGKYKRISYEEAAKEIADKIKECGEKYGPGSRYMIYSTGVCAVARPDHLMKRLLCLDGGYLQHYNSYSSAQANYITPYIYGTERTNNHPADVMNSKLIILWGHNTAESIIGPFRNYYFAKAKEAGVRIVVIDPRNSESALTFADEWIPIKPGSDCAMANAMAFVIFQKNLQDQEFMNKFCVGFDEAHMPEGVPVGESYKSYLFGLQDGIVRDPKWAEEICGVPAEKIEELAVEYATSKPASIQPGLGVQRTFIGENAIRAISALCAMTGNVGIPGGGAGGTVTPNGHYEAQEMFKPENGCTYSTPVFLWSKIIDKWETMTAEEDGIKGADKLPCGIKLMFSLASNVMMNQHSDLNDTQRILSDTSKCELIVNSDLFYTSSVRWSDIVLPGASLFETEFIPSVWNSDDYVLYANQCTQPLFGSVFEYEWMKLVAKDMGLYEAFTDGCETRQDWSRKIYNEDLLPREPELPDFDTFMERGGHMYSGPCDEPVAFRKQIRDGVPFATPSGKIEIFSKQLFDMHKPDIGGIPKWFDGPEGPTDYAGLNKYPLQLIGYHTKRRCHSIHDQNQWMEELDPPALWIHPKDAAVRGIEDGDMIEVYNDRGTVRIPAFVTDRIVRGAVALSQGGWYTPDKDGVDVRGSINVLTYAYKPSPVAKGNPQHTNLVEVRKYEAAEGQKPAT